MYARYIPRDLIQKYNLHDLADNRELLQLPFCLGCE